MQSKALLRAVAAHAVTAVVTFAAVVVYYSSGYAWLNVANIQLDDARGGVLITPGLVECNYGDWRKDIVASIHISNWNPKTGLPEIVLCHGRERRAVGVADVMQPRPQPSAY